MHAYSHYIENKPNPTHPDASGFRPQAVPPLRGRCARVFGLRFAGFRCYVRRSRVYMLQCRVYARVCVCIPLAPHARTRMLSMINARNARALNRLYCLLTINSHSCTPHCDCVCVAGCGVARCLRDRKLRDIISLVGWTGGMCEYEL